MADLGAPPGWFDETAVISGWFDVTNMISYPANNMAWYDVTLGGGVNPNPVGDAVIQPTYFIVNCGRMMGRRSGSA